MHHNTIPMPQGPAQDTLALVGRILLAILFIPAGFSKVAGFAGTVGYIGSVGLPMPQVAAVLAILAELGLGLALLLGFKTRLAALGLAVFTLAASFFFHNYWAMPADKASMQQLLFMKNVAVTGGLLAFAAFGGGRFSLDRR
jgi:putative oxidoreductase